MIEVLHDRHIPSRVHLQIGALDSIPKQVILLLSQAAYEIGPCSVSLVEGNIDQMMRELLAHRLDLLVTNYIPTSSDLKGLHHRSVIKQSVSIYGAPSFKHLRKNFPKSVSGQPFVLPTYDSNLRYKIEYWAKMNEVNMDIVAETQDISLKKLMCIEQLGLIPAAKHTVQRQIQSGDLVEIGKLKGISEELFLISAERKISNPFASKLMKSFVIQQNS